jgi:Terpene synthase family 2, C-terminal metal binding
MAPPAALGAQRLPQPSRGRSRPRPYRPREPFRQGERPVATAARPVFTMAEHSYGVEIPPEVVRHPFLLQAGKASTIAIAFAFANDIIGLKADLLRGIRDNLVLSLQEEYGGDLQQNVERAAAHFHRAAAEFSALRARFHSADGSHDPDLDQRHDVAVYLQLLEDWVYEGIKWQLLPSPPPARRFTRSAAVPAGADGTHWPPSLPLTA